jgi:hypothetical protein
LTATWRFIPATEIEINPELTPIVQEIITKPEMNKHGAQNDKQIRNHSAPDWVEARAAGTAPRRPNDTLMRERCRSTKDKKDRHDFPCPPQTKKHRRV